jgi:hypothetical protein
VISLEGKIYSNFTISLHLKFDDDTINGRGLIKGGLLYTSKLV